MTINREKKNQGTVGVALSVDQQLYLGHISKILTGQLLGRDVWTAVLFFKYNFLFQTNEKPFYWCASTVDHERERDELL